MRNPAQLSASLDRHVTRELNASVLDTEGLLSETDMTSTKTVSMLPSAAASSMNAGRLDLRLLGGIAWTATGKWSGQILNWASLLVVARILVPSDFGLVGMAAIYLGLVQTFSEFGVGSAIIALRDLTGEQVAQLNAMALLFGVAGFGLSCAAARPLGVFFHSPQLPAVVVAMGSTFVFLGFRTVPCSLLQREMRFKLLSTMEATQAIAQALGTVAFAAVGFHYWALVLGNIVNAATGAALPLVWRPHRFAWPRFESIRQALRFSWHLLVARLAWYGYSNADFLVAGRLLGSASLGAYLLAWNLANIILDQTSALVSRITPAFFSAVQTEHAALRRYLRNLTGGLALVTFPATIGLGLVAPEFVRLALGPKWEGVVAPLRLLAFCMSFRSITALLGQVLTVVGETSFVMWNNLAALVLLPAAFFIGSRWGTAGIAWGWILAYPIVVLPLYWRTFRRINIQLREYFATIRAPLNGCAAMAAIVVLLRWALDSRGLQVIRFGLEVLVGATAYVLTVIAFDRNRIAVFWGMIKGLRN
jgi:teichuronic acid exporter